MDPRFLNYYERELRYMRELGAEFAQQFPKVAGRLGVSQDDCVDPHVERLLEAFSFMAARVHLKLDAEYPRFTQQLLQLVYPHYLAPTPSMAVVEFVPSPRQGALQQGFRIARDAVLRTQRGRALRSCEYRTKRELVLWPIELEEVEYTSVLQPLAEVRFSAAREAKALLRIRLRTTDGVRFEQLGIENLPLFLRGGDELAFRLHEQLVSASLGVLVRPLTQHGRPQSVTAVRDALSDGPYLRALGFSRDEALLPYDARSFQGYRLLHEYFAFPSRFAFVELLGLEAGVRACASERLELIIPLSQYDAALEAAVDAARIALFAVPAVNLFPRECDRIQLSERAHELHVVPDRVRPLDLEVHTLQKVAAYGTGTTVEREFMPLYSARDRLDPQRPAAYYTLARRPRALSSRQQREGARSDYLGSEVFLTLVDGERGSHDGGLRTLGVTALCTNRDLPLLLALGRGEQDFALQSAAPIDAIRCIAGPSAPRWSPIDGDVAWRLVSHLALNYHSLCEAGPGGAAEPLREMLGLYAELGDPVLRKQVEGLTSVAARSVARPLPGPGPMSFGRGLEITLDCDERAFHGMGPFVLGSVLAHFFAKYASINSFAESVLRTRERGEVYRWPTTAGLRHVV